MQVKMLSKMALPTDNWKNLGSHTLIVGLAAGLTYLSQHVGEQDFGQYTPLVVALVSVTLTYINKVIQNDVSPVSKPQEVNVVQVPIKPTDNSTNFPLK